MPTEKSKGLGGCLKESDGKVSSMRVMCMLSLFASFYFAWMTLSMLGTPGVEASNMTIAFQLTSLFVLGAFAPKSVQKFFENKTLPPNNNIEK